MEGKDVEDFSSQEYERQRYEVSREQKQSGYELNSEEENREMGVEIAMKNCEANGFGGGG